MAPRKRRRKRRNSSWWTTTTTLWRQRCSHQQSPSPLPRAKLITHQTSRVLFKVLGESEGRDAFTHLQENKNRPRTHNQKKDTRSLLAAKPSTLAAENEWSSAGSTFRCEGDAKKKKEKRRGRTVGWKEWSMVGRKKSCHEAKLFFFSFFFKLLRTRHAPLYLKKKCRLLARKHKRR